MVTVDPITGTAVVGQSLPITTHATDTVGVSRIELRVSGVVVATASSPNPAGQPRLDAALAWTPGTAGAIALIVTAYRPDGTPSQPAVVAVAVAPASSASTMPQPRATPAPTAVTPPVTEPPSIAPATPGPTATPTEPPTPKPTHRPTPRPTLQPTLPPTATPTEPPTPTPTETPLPDLAITVNYPSSASINTQITAGAYIKNLGPGDAGAFGAGWSYTCPNGGGGTSLNEDPLTAGQEHFVDIKFTSDTAGTCTVSIVVDSENAVPETNEDNNEYDFTVAVN